MNFSKAGIVFELKASITPFIHTPTSRARPTSTSAGRSLLASTISWISAPLGKILIRCDANGSLNFGIRNKIAFATFQAGLQFEAWQVNTGLLTLDVDGRALEKIADTLLAELKKVFVDGLLKDVQRFVDWAKRGLLEGVASVSRSPGS